VIRFKDYSNIASPYQFTLKDTKEDEQDRTKSHESID